MLLLLDQSFPFGQSKKQDKDNKDCEQVSQNRGSTKRMT